MSDVFLDANVGVLVRNGTLSEDLPEITKSAILTASQCYFITDADAPFVLTSIREGKHIDGSRHYLGYAFDIRTRATTGRNLSQFDNDTKLALKKRIEDALGKCWRVLAKPTHIHVEYQGYQIITR